MDASQKELLTAKGFDVEGTLKRFLNNETLYMKCLKKFLDDTSFEKLKEACEAGNCNEAFKWAHTMKGFVANLGINELYHLLIPMVEKLRAQDMDVGEEMEKLELLYREAYKTVQDL